MDDTELQALPCFSLLSRPAGISKRVLGKHMNDRRKRGEGQTSVGRVGWNDGKYGEGGMLLHKVFIAHPVYFYRCFLKKRG